MENSVMISSVLPGGFISRPLAFTDARPDLQGLLKLLYRPTVVDGTVCLEFSTDAAVIDFSTVDVNAINIDKVVADCDHIKDVVETHGLRVRRLVKEMQRGTEKGVEEAMRIAKEIGLTEGDAVKAGGGLLFLVVIAVAALTGAGCGGALKEKATSPGASTTPKPSAPR